MLRLGKGIDRKAVRRALARRGSPTFVYEGILQEEDIREAVAGVRDAGSPRRATPLLAWLAAHPNAPKEVLRDLRAHGPREVLMGLAFNPKLPGDLKRALLSHEDEEVREHASQAFARRRRA